MADGCQQNRLPELSSETLPLSNELSQKYATILGLYYIREGSGLGYSYTKFTLREDAQGHWKLLYWELADESDINE